MSENYSYDSIGAANASSSALQAGFVNRVFGWMTGGLALTGAMAWAVYNIEPLYKLVLGTPGVFTVLIILELVVVIAMSAAVNKLSSA